MRENSITRTINVCRKLELPDRVAATGRDSRRGVTSGRVRERNSFHPLPSSPRGAIEAGAMLGSHRERNPSRSENWHHRTTIYIPLPPRHILLSVPPPRIPRNSAAGDWRWRPRALRDKPHQHTAVHQRQPDSQPPRIYLVIVEAQKLSEIRARRAGGRGGGYIKCIKYGSDSPPPRPLCGDGSSRLYSSILIDEYNVRGYSNNRDSGLCRCRGVAKSSPDSGLT